MANWIEKIEPVLKWIEIPAKLIGGLLIILSALVLLVPWLDSAVSGIVAKRLGARGFVYYEIDHDNQPSSFTNYAEPGDDERWGDGGLFLLTREPEPLYSTIKVYDKLQAATATFFRVGASTDDRKMFVLNPGDCVIVLETVEDKTDKLVDAKSGGWLEVATVACGLFR